MSISTGRGDAGETDLWKGGRVPKDHPRIEVCGQLDELAAALGAARSQLPASSSALSEDLGHVQDFLFAAGSVAAAPAGVDPGSGWDGGSRAIPFAEDRIRRLEAALPSLRQFIRPAGPPPAAALHVARAVCRRAERHLVRLGQMEAIEGSLIVFLNRLGDLLFLWARQVHQATGVPEEPWRPG
jgi:cob(I)alamin adenosyltransferase